MSARIYTRYSTDRQDAASITDQTRVCREWAEARNIAVADIHADEGISGAAMANRPALQACLRGLGRGDYLVVMDLSRLARSQDLAPLVARLKHRGARVIGVQDGFDSDTRHARMQAGLSGIMSEEFRASVAARTHSALDLRARTGGSTGGKAYGNPEIIREIFQRFVDGETMREIAADLNRRGIPSPGAGWKSRGNGNPRGKWLVSAVRALLQNERYAGRVVWNRSQWVKNPETGGRERVERPESEWVVSECDPIVDRETWNLAQSRFRRNTGRGGVRRYALSGILECELCGSKLIVMNGGERQRYVCGAYHAGGAAACPNRTTVPRRLAENLILAKLTHHLLSPENVKAGVAALRSVRVDLERQGPPLENDEEATLQRLVREGLLSADTARPALEAARAKAATAKPVTLLPWPTEKLWWDGVTSLATKLQSPDALVARDALRVVVGSVRVQPVDGGARARFAQRPAGAFVMPVYELVAGAGFEPATFGL